MDIFMLLFRSNEIMCDMPTHVNVCLFVLKFNLKSYALSIVTCMCTETLVLTS